MIICYFATILNQALSIERIKMIAVFKNKQFYHLSDFIGSF